MTSKTPIQTSLFLTKLPLELRLQIYTHIFESTVFRYGSASLLASDLDDPTPTLHPPPPSKRPLSILLTCRQITLELPLTIWPRLSTFNFATTSSLVFFLARLPSQLLPHIRHVIVKAFPIPFSTKSGVTVVYSIQDFLPLFPGLALDVLTVYDAYHDPGVNDGWGDSGTYLTVEDLLKTNGWKELHFYSPTSEFLAFGPPHRQAGADAESMILERSIRWPQPSGWQELLRELDGEDSGASVKIYRARKACTEGNDGTDCAGLQLTGIEFRQASLPVGATQGLLQDHTLLGEKEPNKGVMVVATRGENINYKQDGSGLTKLLKTMRENMTWEEIRSREVLQDALDDPCVWL